MGGGAAGTRLNPLCFFGLLRWPEQNYQCYDLNTERVAMQRRVEEDDGRWTQLQTISANLPKLIGLNNTTYTKRIMLRVFYTFF